MGHDVVEPDEMYLNAGEKGTEHPDPDGPPKGTMLKGPWGDLDPKWQAAWLHGLGDRPMVFYWKSKGKMFPHSEPWKGIATELTKNGVLP